MVENSKLPGSVSGTRPPERLAALPYPPEDNARKRFDLERERRRAEKSRKDDKDPRAPQDRWERDRPDEPAEPASPAAPATPEGDAEARKPRQEGGLDVVA